MDRTSRYQKHILPLSSQTGGPTSANFEDFLRDILRDAFGDRVVVKDGDGDGSKKIFLG